MGSVIEKSLIRICLWGARGRMGQALCEVVPEMFSDQVEVVLGVVEPSDGARGSMQEGILEPLVAEWPEKHPPLDMIIDFSSADGTRQAIVAAVAHSIPLLTCTTGLPADVEQMLEAASKDIPVLRANNTSHGMNLVFWLVEMASKLLKHGFEIEVTDIHHQHKKDAPSGTALQLVSHAGQDPEEVKITSIREGEVPGEHRIVFRDKREEITISHKVMDRKVFAEGAVHAALWLCNKKPGKHTMADVMVFPV